MRLFKRGLYLVMCLVMVMALVPKTVFAAETTADVDTIETFQDAVENEDITTIKLAKDLDFTNDWEANSSHVLDIKNKTLDLNGYTIIANNFSLVFQGTDCSIKNGKMDSNGGSYALFIGNDDNATKNFVVDGVKLNGGINIFDTTSVTINNCEVSGTSYYAVYCDEGGTATIESGKYSSKSTKANALFALSNNNSTLNISGGTFKVDTGQSLVLADNGIPTISGGSFNVPVDAAYCAVGYEPVQLSDGSYSVCNHQQFSKEWKYDEVAHWHECFCGQYMDAYAEHTFSDWEVTKAATTTSTGTKVRKCSVCGYTETAEIPMIGEVVIDNTDKPNKPTIETPIEEIKKSVLTPEDIERINNGENVTIDLVVEDISDQISQEEKTLVNETLSGSEKVALYLNIELIKTIGDDATLVTNTNGKIKISFKLPQRYINTDGTMSREFVIIRIHDGVKTKIDCTYNPKTQMITFETDKFSTYALAYQDTLINATNIATSPETGDHSNVAGLMMMLGLSGLWMGIRMYNLKERNK